MHDNFIFTGTQVNYFAVCHRKLWLYSQNIHMEQESDLVLQGKVIGEQSYGRRMREINIDGLIVLDSFDRRQVVIHEVKKSKSIHQAHIKQVQYYMYMLAERGVQAEAVIDYPLLKRQETVTLTEQDITQLQDDLQHIQQIIALPKPPAATRKKICSKCSYFDLCFI